MSQKSLNKLLTAIFVALAMAACHGVPSDVIQPEEMAQLMADIHTGEAVVDMNRRDYETDSAKQAFKQSVYAAHGVTADQVDSSMVWYGRNITKYIDVYDRTIEILEHRLNEMGNRVAAEAAMSASGDSVDVWPYARYLAISPLSPTNIITFGFGADENWQPGDVYTWRAKFFNNGSDSEWKIAAAYDDGAVETIYTTNAGDGWREITLRSDSTRSMVRIAGYLLADLPGNGTLRLDSIALVRKRLNPARYTERYRQRSVANYGNADAPADTIE